MSTLDLHACALWGVYIAVYVQGLRSAAAHPLWRLEGSWIHLEPASAAAIAAAAAEAAAAAAADAESGEGEQLPPRWGLSYSQPLLYRQRKAP